MTANWFMYLSTEVIDEFKVIQSKPLKVSIDIFSVGYFGQVP